MRSFVQINENSVVHFLELKLAIYVIRFYITGVCLFLSQEKSELDYVDCKDFKFGCPTIPYRGSTVYKCKIVINHQVPLGAKRAQT